MPIQPLFDHVLVKRTKQARTTASGLILPDSTQEKMNRGVVISVGTGNVDDSGDTQNLEVQEGDTVVFGKYSGSSIQDENGEDLLILKEKDILGIITK
jgi:chaperonin GroES